MHFQAPAATSNTSEETFLEIRPWWAGSSHRQSVINKIYTIYIRNIHGSCSGDKGILPQSRVTHRIVGQKQLQRGLPVKLPGPSPSTILRCCSSGSTGCRRIAPCRSGSPASRPTPHSLRTPGTYRLQNKSVISQFEVIIYQGQFHTISAFRYDKIEIEALDKGILPQSRVTHRIVGQKQLQKNEKMAYRLQFAVLRSVPNRQLRRDDRVG